ncbi:MAG: DUF839 domain-containing protein [Pseudobacteriovorax sp.]|nr:DUF839 domain-containing protein [Pseudobacteriovorax sp.]
MTISRRLFFASGAVTLGSVTSLGSVVRAAGHPSSKTTNRSKTHSGYGELVKDPKDLLDLPKGFQYRTLSIEKDLMTSGGIVPSAHDGMAAFSAGPGKTFLVRNHELKNDDIIEDGLAEVAQAPGTVYDLEVQAGGTTTLLIDNQSRGLIEDRVSLSGTLDNCAGGATPWQT